MPLNPFSACSAPRAAPSPSASTPAPAPATQYVVVNTRQVDQVSLVGASLIKGKWGCLSSSGKKFLPDVGDKVLDITKPLVITEKSDSGAEQECIATGLVFCGATRFPDNFDLSTLSPTVSQIHTLFPSQGIKFKAEHESQLRKLGFNQTDVLDWRIWARAIKNPETLAAASTSQNTQVQADPTPAAATQSRNTASRIVPPPSPSPQASSSPPPSSSVAPPQNATQPDSPALQRVFFMTNDSRAFMSIEKVPAEIKKITINFKHGKTALTADDKHALSAAGFIQKNPSTPLVWVRNDAAQ